MYKFTAKERDAETGNDYFGARYYGSTMGRFLSPDYSDAPEAMPYADLSNPQSFNRYVYLNDNPLSGIDADGHQTKDQNGNPCDWWGVLPGRSARTGDKPVSCGASAAAMAQHQDQTSSSSQNGNNQNPTQQHTSKPGNAGYRAPDFLSLNLNVAIPNPLTGTGVGMTFAVNVDRNGNLYFGLGPDVGKALTMISGSVTADWLNQRSKPSDQQLNGYLTKSSIGGTAGYFGGVQEGYTPGSGWATGAGFVSPQGGLAYTYSWRETNLGLKW